MKGRDKTTCSPHDDLYIYVVEGVLTRVDESLLGENFVGNWVEGDMSFLFFRDSADSVMEGLVRENPRLTLVENHQFPYEEWQGELHGPVGVDRFLIVPPWVGVDSQEGQMVIRLDPGVVFGSGLHPTTRDCLKALGVSHDRGVFHHVLDLGTGTGILGIAAALLGAEQVVAVDINPLCVETAFRNVKRNRLEATIQVRQERAEDLAAVPGELLIANIHYDVLKQLMDQGFIRLFQKIILSGLMRSHVREVRTELAKNGTEIIQEWDHEMTWYTLLADCRSSR